MLGGIKMNANQYLENNQKAFDEGKISAEAYDAAIMNMPTFLDNEEQRMLVLEQQGGII
jgi:hypothetical protein